MGRISILVVILSACFTSLAWAGNCCADAPKFTNLPGTGTGDDCKQYVALEKAYQDATDIICVGEFEPVCSGRKACDNPAHVCRATVEDPDGFVTGCTPIKTLDCVTEDGKKKKGGYHCAVVSAAWTCGCDCKGPKPTWESGLE
jgi:hypothetical protein